MLQTWKQVRAGQIMVFRDKPIMILQKSYDPDWPDGRDLQILRINQDTGLLLRSPEWIRVFTKDLGGKFNSLESPSRAILIATIPQLYMPPNNRRFRPVIKLGTSHLRRFREIRYGKIHIVDTMPNGISTEKTLYLASYSRKYAETGAMCGKKDKGDWKKGISIVTPETRHASSLNCICKKCLDKFLQVRRWELQAPTCEIEHLKKLLKGK